MKQIFTTQMDNTVKITTTIVHFAILPIPIVLYFQAGIELALLNVLILGVLFSLSYVLRPYQYVIDELGISVHKQLWPKKIPFHNIASIETIAYKELKVRLRLWGSGGLWGWFGFFLSPPARFRLLLRPRNHRRPPLSCLVSSSLGHPLLHNFHNFPLHTTSTQAAHV